MPFSTNQIVWAKPRTEDWQPAFVIDVANDIWSFWSGPIEQSRIGYRHVFIIDSKSIELVNEENSIRDFCLGYAESYQSVVVGSDAMKALPLLVQMAAILSGEEIYPGQDWDWQIWAINFIRNCEPIRVSKKFYEKFTKKSRGQISPTIRNSSSMSPETIVIPSVSDDAVVTEKPAPVLTRCVGARKTIRSTGEKSPPKMPETDNIAIFEPESCYNSETKSTLRASQLVWAFRSGGLKERWWPAVVIEMPTGGSRTAIVSALNKTFDLFCARVTQIEDFCKSFNARVNRVDLKDPEERGNYKYAVRKAVEYVQEAIGGVNCEEDQWLHWALQNVAPYGIGGSVGLGAAQWNNILARTQNQLVQLKRREFGPDQRVSSSEPLHADSAALKGGREKYTSPEQVKKRSDMETIFGSKLMDTYHAVSDMDQLADESSADHKSRKKRKRDEYAGHCNSCV
uniref:PWWP domain-containing protein n=1 Tax=Plectus sambesii TaxID=2011161 RepID=A0A914XD77_9BILA